MDALPCIDCGERPRTLRSNGKPHSYCLECRRERNLNNYRTNRSSHQARQRRRTLAKYGMTPCAYTRMLIQQGGVCAVCGTFEPTGRGEMAVDHDHATGAVRGLLCLLCNTAIGKFSDDPIRMRAAADYIERTSA